MHYVYLLKLNDGSLYIGRSDDLKRRYSEHQCKKVKPTRSKLPITLIYYEAYIQKQDATDRKLYLKTGDGRRNIKKQLKKTLSLPGGEVA